MYIRIKKGNKIAEYSQVSLDNVSIYVDLIVGQGIPYLEGRESGPSSGVKDDQMQRGRIDAKPNSQQGRGAVFTVGIEGYIQISGYAPDGSLGATQHEP